MPKEKRRSTRVQGKLPVTLVLRDNASGANLTGPFSGQVDDMSAHGVRITLPHIRIEKYHLFYAFNDNTNETIYLEINPLEGNTPIVIPARPVWFDHILSEPSKPFQLGMEFMVDPEDDEVLRLKGLMEHRKREEGRWWQKLFG